MFVCVRGRKAGREYMRMNLMELRTLEELFWTTVNV